MRCNLAFRDNDSNYGHLRYHSARISSDHPQPNHAMNALTVQFPESLQRNITALAEREGYTLDQFLASAAAEKMAALMTLDYLRREAGQGRREDFDRFLAAVPHRAPEETDRLPE
jgi:hypothetical protein